jgi:hypothetical protein
MRLPLASVVLSLHQHSQHQEHDFLKIKYPPTRSPPYRRAENESVRRTRSFQHFSRFLSEKPNPKTAQKALSIMEFQLFFLEISSDHHALFQNRFHDFHD